MKGEMFWRPKKHVQWQSRYCNFRCSSCTTSWYITVQTSGESGTRSNMFLSYLDDLWQVKALIYGRRGHSGPESMWPSITKWCHDHQLAMVCSNGSNKLGTVVVLPEGSRRFVMVKHLKGNLGLLLSLSATSWKHRNAYVWTRWVRIRTWEKVKNHTVHKNGEAHDLNPALC